MYGDDWMKSVIFRRDKNTQKQKKNENLVAAHMA